MTPPHPPSRFTFHASRLTFHVSRFARHALHATLFAPLLLLFFHKMAFTNLILARGDTFLYFYPYWQAAADALHAGRLPLWNPHLFMGAPFLANSQVGFFYPLNWPLWLLLPTPYAVNASILLHLFIAGLGTYLAGRRCLRLSPLPALLSAVLFALGGYLTAQVEHVNQLQGLAWLPWFLLAMSGVSTARKVAAFALLFSLQLLAGHTQTVMITAVGLLIWLLPTVASSSSRITHHASRITFHVSRFRSHLLPLLLGGFLALLISAVQLLPTLELAGLSSRQGGLPFNEVVSFSLNPLLLAQSLLPGYGRSLFSEYVAFLPITALLLAIIGAWQWRQQPAIRPILLLAVVGLLLALGIFNPLYWLLGRLPLFNLFRAPARWLALYALAGSLLAGMGLQQLKRESNDASRITHRPLLFGTIIIVALMLWSAVAVPLSRFIPVGPEAPVALPTWTILAGWVVELAVAWLLLLPRFVGRFAKSPYLLTLSSCLLVTLSLFLASRSLPYNNLTTPEAYFDLRPPITRLQVSGKTDPIYGLQSPLTTPGRFLSLSGIFFDPGDQAEIDTIYADQLPPAAQYDYTIAIKQKEIIGPNLSLAYGLEAVDGFDGGVLPLRSYTLLTSLILAEGQVSTDGRLREYLEQVPEARWLDLFNARYLITDKVGDVWHEEVFFDLQHPVTLSDDETATVGYLPDYEATELWLAAEGEPGQVEIATSGGEIWQLLPEPLADAFYRVVFPQPAVAQSITLSPCHLVTLSPCHDQWSIAGLTLVDGRDETFHPLVLGQYQLIHSGDVKIYENLDVLPRAFLVSEWQWQPDLASSSAAIADPAFDFSQSAVLIGSGQPHPNAGGDSGEATLINYQPERVVIETESTADTLLLLTDAWYPGWQATVDGQYAPIHQANVLFRAVFVPAGTQQVIFTFSTARVQIGAWLSTAGVVGWLLLLASIWVAAHRKDSLDKKE